MRRLVAAVLLACCGAAAAPARAAPTAPTTPSAPSAPTAPTTPPQRIVSLLPSLTETVCALGACARLVGTDRHSNHPRSVRALPKLGGLDDPQIEAIAALRPDLVLVASASRVSERLESLGLRVLALEPRNHAGMRRVTDTLAGALGLPAADGAALWQRIEAELDAAVRSVPPAARGRSVYYEIDSSPYAAGAASFIGETLARLGAHNIVPARLGPFPKLNPEYVVRADPQIVFVAESGADGLLGRPGWAGMRALRAGHVCRLSAAQSDVVVRPGPRLGEGAAQLASCLRRFGAVTAAVTEPLTGPVTGPETGSVKGPVTGPVTAAKPGGASSARPDRAARAP